MADPTDYRSLAGALQYLTFTRPDIAYAVQQVCLYMHDPRESHLAALKRILRYIRGTLHLGFSFGLLFSLILLSIQMLIGLAVLTLGALLLAMQSSWEITWFPGLPNVRMLCLDPVQKLSTGLLPMRWLRCPGCANS